METGEDVLTSNEGTQTDVVGIATESSRGGSGSHRGKLTRNVSFPDDGSLVQALEPENPWKDGERVFLFCSSFFNHNPSEPFCQEKGIVF